ncbi:snaclec convulxin subunit alpha-like [Asterias rubens]|uniref:snaclec convulxin subunit alpha-like n=1 Tax=Asterias rubens TaxID=7604 RepID=UPI0014551C7F|nr:snaclec convulxin subunit alpha-like [Asterias rubens]
MSPSSFSEMIVVLLVMVSILRALHAACPPGWLTWQDSCYILLPQKMNWFDASKACDRPGVSLVSTNSTEEHNFLWGNMTKWMTEFGAISRSDLQLWINCYRDSNKQPFICSGYDGILSFRNWDDGEPSDLFNEECARMAKSIGGRWADGYCDSKYFVACEMSAFAYGCRQSSRRYKHIPQQCLLNHQIKSYPVKESIGCGQACWAEPLCRSFNLLKQDGIKPICQLNHASRMDADGTDIKYEENCYLYEP